MGEKESEGRGGRGSQLEAEDLERWESQVAVRRTIEARADWKEAQEESKEEWEWGREEEAQLPHLKVEDLVQVEDRWGPAQNPHINGRVQLASL